MDTTKTGGGMLLTPRATLSYPALLKPKEDQNGRMKFSCALIFDAEAQATPEFAAFRAAVKACAIKRFGSPLPPKAKSPFRDGAEKTKAGGHTKDVTGYGPGLIFVNVTEAEDRPPTLVGPDGRPMRNPSAWYAGAIVRAKVVPYAFDTSGNKGVTLYLKGVQWLADGTPLAPGSGPAEFDAVPGAAMPSGFGGDSFADESGAPEAEVTDEDNPF